MAMSGCCPQWWRRGTVRHGTVVWQVGSLSGEVGLPMRSAYCASKFAIAGWLEALRIEMKMLALPLQITGALLPIIVWQLTLRNVLTGQLGAGFLARSGFAIVGRHSVPNAQHRPAAEDVRGQVCRPDYSGLGGRTTEGVCPGQGRVADDCAAVAQ